MHHTVKSDQRSNLTLRKTANKLTSQTSQFTLEFSRQFNPNYFELLALLLFEFHQRQNQRFLKNDLWHVTSTETCN